MPKLFHVGKPFTPPTIHGYAFSEGENNVWSADVREEDFPKFLIGVEGSPFSLTDPNAPAPAPQTDQLPPPPPAPADPAPTAPVGEGSPAPAPAPDPAPLEGGQGEGAPAGDAPTGDAPEGGAPGEGPNASGDLASFPELEAYNALPDKASIATKAAKELGLALDTKALRRDELLAAVLGALREKKALTNQQ